MEHSNFLFVVTDTYKDNLIGNKLEKSRGSLKPFKIHILKQVIVVMGETVNIWFLVNKKLKMQPGNRGAQF